MSCVWLVACFVADIRPVYDGTIAYNIRLGAFEDADDVTDQMLQRAAANANILSFIESLPNGWDTEVGGKGTQLR